MVDLYEVHLQLLSDMLGTAPKDPAVYAAHVASKVSEEVRNAELELLEDADAIEKRGWTGFRYLNGTPGIPAYMVRGYFKAACKALRRVSGTRSSGVRAYKQVIDTLVFVHPWFIPLEVEGEITYIERPIRVDTPQGQRVATVRSDVCPAGSKLSFYVAVLGLVSGKLLREWLDYGALQGLGQWRSGGFGRFTYEIVARRELSFDEYRSFVTEVEGTHELRSLFEVVEG